MSYVFLFLSAFCMKPKPKTYKIQGFSVTKSVAHVDTERSNSCHVLSKTNATTLSAGYKQVKHRYMYPGCWMFPRVTSLAFRIGTNSKAQHMIAHGQDDQRQSAHFVVGIPYLFHRLVSTGTATRRWTKLFSSVAVVILYVSEPIEVRQRWCTFQGILQPSVIVMKSCSCMFYR
jgi:hypothetical protein